MKASTRCSRWKSARRMVRRAVRHLPNVEADAFTGLLVHYAERKRAQAIDPRVASGIGL